jgi:hypothetical protein
MQAGEDLVQAALEQVLPRWRTIDGDPGARRMPPGRPWPAAQTHPVAETVTGPTLRLVVRETT